MKHIRSSIKLRLSAISMAAVIMALLVLSISLYMIYSRNYRETIHQHKQQTLELLNYNTTTYFDELNRLTLSAIGNSYLLQRLTLTEPGTKYEALERRREIESFLTDSMILQRHDIVSVFILMVDTDEVYRAGRTEVSIDEEYAYKEAPWFQDVLSTSHKCVVPPHFEALESGTHSPVFSLVRLITNPSTLRPIAVIKVNVNTESLNNYFSQIDVGSAGGIILFDNANQVFLSQCAQSDLAETFLQVRHTRTDTWVQVDYKNYIYNETAPSSYGLQICSFSSTEDLEQIQHQQLTITLWIALICGTLAIVVSSRLFASHFIRPVNDIVTVMKQVEQGNMEAVFVSDHDDEIAYLGNRFNEMVQNINRSNTERVQLLTEVYEARELQSQAQLHALQAQIKPHFLCNTLNMISMMVQINEKSSAVENINRLSRLMRGITNFNTNVPLQQELSLLHAYLDIQKTRYSGRLEYYEDISPSLHTYLIPTFTLQPIVENTILHGCENNPGLTTIRIYSKVFTDHLEIIVSDTACGIPEDILEQLKQNLALGQQKESSSHGIGLLNIHNRIRLCFGEQYGLKVSSVYGCGATVSVSLPLPGDEIRS